MRRDAEYSENPASRSSTEHIDKRARTLPSSLSSPFNDPIRHDYGRETDPTQRDCTTAVKSAGPSFDREQTDIYSCTVAPAIMTEDEVMPKDADVKTEEYGSDVSEKEEAGEFRYLFHIITRQTH